VGNGIGPEFKPQHLKKKKKIPIAECKIVQVLVWHRTGLEF
jgi:hypothetical protein